MAKAILEFDLPEDRCDFDLARRGGEYFSLLEEVYRLCRNKLKHEDLGEETVLVLAEIKRMIDEENIF